MCELCKNDIDTIFEEIKPKIELLKEKYDVKPIRNPYSDFGLAMIYLYHYMGTPVKINDVKDFVKKYHTSNSSVTLYLRHLRTEFGYYVLGSNGVHNDIKVKRDEYMLVSLDVPHPDYIPNRHIMLSEKDFNKVKEEYNNCCATCGDKEGEISSHNSKVNTYLQQGHKDPNKPMTIDNCIPQCQFCNGVAKDTYNFDSNGLPSNVNNVKEYVKLLKSINDKLAAYIYLEEDLKREGVLNESIKPI